MTDFREPAVLGRTGLKVGRLGIASGYGAPAAAIEEAFERGSNYFTWGTVIKGYARGMREALRNIVAKGQRDRLVLADVHLRPQQLLHREDAPAGAEERRAGPRRRPDPGVLLAARCRAGSSTGPCG